MAIRSLPRRRSHDVLHVGTVVAGSLAAGFAAAVILPFLPVGTVDVNFSTAMVLFGFALGWALLAVLSTRFTDQPQRWAVAPAIFMALSGVLVLVAPDSVVDALGWVWPPALVVLVVWVWTRARRELHSRTRAWLLNPVLVILVLLALGGGYETISQSIAPAVAMRGQLVDVGPYRLHLECTGSRGPTVILEPGGGGSAASMGLIAPAVARDSRVCVYDRAGRGWSDPAASPPDGAQIATDLHTLLTRAHVPGPYVLAGHSFGGLYVRTYAAKYPEEVAGLVLVDSTAAHEHPRVRAEGRFLQRLEARVLVGRDDLSAGARSADRRHRLLVPAAEVPGRCTGHRRHREGDGRLPRRVRRRESVRGRGRAAPQPRREATDRPDRHPRQLPGMDGRLRTRWSRCRPTASIASYQGQPTPPSWTTRTTPPRSPGRSTTSSSRCGPGHRSAAPDTGLASGPARHRGASSNSRGYSQGATQLRTPSGARWSPSVRIW